MAPRRPIEPGDVPASNKPSNAVTSINQAFQQAFQQATGMSSIPSGSTTTTGGTSASSSSSQSSSSSGSVCGPKPSAPAGEGYVWKCDSASKTWVRVKKGGESTTNYKPGQPVGGPDRVTPDGGAVVNGIYIPPGTFGAARPPAFEGEDGGTTPRPDLFGPGDMVQVPATGKLPAPVEEEVPLVDDATQALIAWQQAQAAMVQQERQESARAVITSLLADYGLDTLADTVWQWIQGGDTESASLIQRIRKTNEYQQRFPAMEMRRAAGMNMISERDYIGLENRYRQSLRAAGLPPGLFDQPEELSRLIGFDVSPDELNARIDEGYQQVARSNPEVVRQMTRLYGVTEGELVGYFLDPERTLPMLTRRARAAQIAGQGTLQAGIEITAGQAEELATQGITQQQAQTSFQAIAGAQELFGGLVGTTEQAIGTEEQIAGVFGTSAAAQQRIRQRTRERQSIFEAGGRFAAGQGGTVTGLQ